MIDNIRKRGTFEYNTIPEYNNGYLMVSRRPSPEKMCLIIEYAQIVKDITQSLPFENISQGASQAMLKEIVQ